jgi:iron-sulfur cluster repair protein YtfE (RIC family)
MTDDNRVCQRIHDEHMATLAVLERLERFVAAGVPPDAADPAARRLLVDLAVAFENEIWRHFAFEEKHLFGYFDESGEPEMGRHLTDEHVQIRSLGAPLIAMARSAAVSGFTPAAWNEFRPLARQLAEQLSAHAQKEEGVLIPLLQDNMDGDTEERLYEAYVMNEEAF